jgi:hypothetical protein
MNLLESDTVPFMCRATRVRGSWLWVDADRESGQPLRNKTEQIFFPRDPACSKEVRAHVYRRQ